MNDVVRRDRAISKINENKIYERKNKSAQNNIPEKAQLYLVNSIGNIPIISDKIIGTKTIKILKDYKFVGKEHITFIKIKNKWFIKNLIKLPILINGFQIPNGKKVEVKLGDKIGFTKNLIFQLQTNSEYKWNENEYKDEPEIISNVFEEMSEPKKTNYPTLTINKNSKILLFNDKNIIGRTSLGKDVFIKNGLSGKVSNKQLNIFKFQNEWYVKDIGNDYPVYLNNQEILKNRDFELQENDTIMFGKYNPENQFIFSTNQNEISKKKNVTDTKEYKYFTSKDIVKFTTRTPYGIRKGFEIKDDSIIGFDGIGKEVFKDFDTFDKHIYFKLNLVAGKWMIKNMGSDFQINKTTIKRGETFYLKSTDIISLGDCVLKMEVETKK